MILTLLAGKRSRIINSFMCVLGGMLCWTLGSFSDAYGGRTLLHPVVLCVSGRNPVSAIFYYVFISEFMGSAYGQKKQDPIVFD